MAQLPQPQPRLHQQHPQETPQKPATVANGTATTTTTQAPPTTSSGNSSETCNCGKPYSYHNHNPGSTNNILRKLLRNLQLWQTLQLNEDCWRPGDRGPRVPLAGG